MIKLQKYSVSNFLFVVFAVFCINFTELKVDVVKIAEILLLVITPFLYFKKINKWVLMILVLFVFWFVVSIALNPFRDFYLLKNVSVLKRPYLITLGRFLELLSCVNLTTLVYRFFKHKNYKEVKTLLKHIFYLNGLILLIFLSIFALKHFNFISESNILYYGDIYGDRLRGGYGEGGPYGLMLSFTFCISYLFKSKFNNFFRILIVFTIIFFARSKAGLLCVIIWLLIVYYEIIYNKVKQLNIVLIIAGSLIISTVFVKLADNYIKEIKLVEEGIIARPNDINLVMGRIAGLFIFPEMIVENPFLGIGLGNYPIMRNNPKYLGVIPHSPSGKTDAHGYGGIIQLLVDGGLVTLSIFMFIIYSFYKKIKYRKDRLGNFLLIFLCLFMLGVQIYFLYPWFLFGVLLVLSEKPIVS